MIKDTHSVSKLCKVPGLQNKTIPCSIVLTNTMRHMKQYIVVCAQCLIFFCIAEFFCFFVILYLALVSLLYKFCCRTLYWFDMLCYLYVAEERLHQGPTVKILKLKLVLHG